MLEKGMIAFFIVFEVISTVSGLVGRPRSTVKKFLHRFTSAALLKISHPPSGLRSLENEINGLSYALFRRTRSTHENMSA